MPIVVFDLDHTLIRCDSFVGFSRYLLRRQWWRAALIAIASPIVAALLISRRTRLLAGSTLIWCATVGMGEEELHRLMDRHVADRFGSGTELVCRSALQALRRHQADGARVLIATGAVGSLADRVCRHIGIRGVEVIGSTLQRWLGGWVADRHCYGARKVAMLVEHGVGERWDFVYTDSAVDLPLLERGSRRYVVNPKPEDREKISALLGPDVEVVEWL